MNKLLQPYSSLHDEQVPFAIQSSPKALDFASSQGNMKVAEVFAHDLVGRAKNDQHMRDMIIKDRAS